MYTEERKGVINNTKVLFLTYGSRHRQRERTSEEKERERVKRERERERERTSEERERGVKTDSLAAGCTEMENE